ncbi:putative HD superfamily hydrolase [Desulfosporosinus acidiphilus SJ4]|uniref:Putative HD superfamily hydrolase n=1 Tax=Desulfosporosinus acidiphilus (strain DSM 22704 / JCM 16185 / SJ4) TaxID=646529 RepID=I4D619_DESAJ|nr:HD domain-containing protein [Desulfosporosinus acidiphilus]AFM41243.1 putative HD superfamily hydrolase [Desulfosporosinus acidiphilus SJ4]
MINQRLQDQIGFIVEIDRLKRIFRQNVVIGTTEQENDAEHSWHMAVMAIILSEYSSVELNILKVLKMILVHDLVEIHAGDTFCYDEEGYRDKDEREQKSADRLFNLLPNDQASEIMSLWHEFEDMATPEAKFAASIDRLQPLLLNYNTNGHTWRKPGIMSDKVLKRNSVLEEPVPILWDLAQKIITDSIEKGYLKK